jgi:hypothetical protein
MYPIGPAYSLLPDGTTFNPTVTLTWSYDSYSLPEGAHEEDLFLAWYDENTGGWAKLDCMVDTVNHTITAEFSRSMTFAAFYEKSESALLTVNNLVESPGGDVAGIDEPALVGGVTPAPAQSAASTNPQGISTWLLAVIITVAVAVIGTASYLFLAYRRQA